MQLYELFIIAVSLSMDAFAVSICKGLSTGRPRPVHCLTCGIWFGAFQAGMPLAGWLLGVRFQEMIVSVDHWVAFLLLGLIGFNMVRESWGGEAEELDCSFSPRAMLPLAVATSIDALAVGVTFAFLQVDNIAAAVAFIGVTTFALSAAGVKVGAVFGSRFKSRAELAGGLVLMGMGVKILVEHTLLA
ncbi:MAG: manganese efflux pump [Lawsonibacter sp.]|nr:manganese efflux pump [Lawsonibacter sp.]